MLDLIEYHCPTFAWLEPVSEMDLDWAWIEPIRWTRVSHLCPFRRVTSEPEPRRRAVSEPPPYLGSRVDWPFSPDSSETI